MGNPFPTMNKPILAAILVLILATLSCQQAITPVVPVSPVPTTSPILADDTATAQPVSSPTVSKVVTATVSHPVVNVRDNPGGIVIGSLQSGDTVTVVSCKDNWCEISTDVLSGFVYRGCISDNPDKLGCEAR